MRLDTWVDYMPPPGSRYRLHYVPDRPGTIPDVAIFKRALDARPSVAVGAVTTNKADNSITAEVAIYVGDAPLITVLGRSISDGAEFWNMEFVERTDDGVPSGVGVVVGSIIDRLFDPLQTATTAAAEAARGTVATVKRVGLPATGLLAVAVVAFLVARARA
jgi:hypothetical protein